MGNYKTSQFYLFHILRKRFSNYKIILKIILVMLELAKQASQIVLFLETTILMQKYS